MGSDFTYDDLGGRHPSEDTHTIIGEESINGKDCYVVESVPKDSDYFYSKTISWVVKGEWFGMKKECYDEDEEFLNSHSEEQLHEWLKNEDDNNLLSILRGVLVIFTPQEGDSNKAQFGTKLHNAVRQFANRSAVDRSDKKR